MTKKITTLILIILTVIAGCIPGTTSMAASPSSNVSKTTITYDNYGGYYVETLSDTVLPISSSSVCYSSNSQVLTKAKTAKYYSSNNTLCWSYTLIASFNVTRGVKSVYRTSRAESAIYNNSWSFVSEKHSGSGTIATGTIIMSNGANLSKTITIECDKYGNFK